MQKKTKQKKTKTNKLTPFQYQTFENVSSYFIPYFCLENLKLWFPLNNDCSFKGELFILCV